MNAGTPGYTHPTQFLASLGFAQIIGMEVGYSHARNYVDTH